MSQWFPRGANAAVHAEVARSAGLATELQSTPAQFGVTKRALDLIRENVGFDPSQIERFTTATLTVGVPGTIIFFTLNEQRTLEEHFSAGQFPITPVSHRFHNLAIYQLASDQRPLGLYSAEGKHFVLGDWGTFKQTLLGNDGQLNELARILNSHTAPIVLCSNPRRAGKRHSKDDPFGTVISIDFHRELLVFLMQEEHPTPAMAATRLAEIETDMPAAFASAYGLETKQGVRYKSLADGRHVVFGAQAPIKISSKLLSHLLGDITGADARADAVATAEDVIKLYSAASVKGVALDRLQSPEAIVDALCVGLEAKDGKRFQLPFLTGIEQGRVAAQIHFEAGKLVLAPEAENDSGPSLAEKEIRRHAQRIAVLTMSAAAAESPQLKKLKTPEEIVEAICSTGLTGGLAYSKETFKAEELSVGERERVTQYLAPHRGYLVFKAD